MRILLLLISFVYAKETIYPKTLYNYLNERNPFVYSAIYKKHLYNAKITKVKGALDTKISGKYDNKKYPASEGSFNSLLFTTPLENGLEFQGGYRYSIGVQEFNNIKTSKEGEYYFKMSMPLRELFMGTNLRKFNLQKASLQAISFDLEAKDNLRKLYFEIVSSYYQLLFSNEILKIEKRLLEKSKKRFNFIKKRVKYGNANKIMQIEAKQQLLNRNQRFINAKNSYDNSFEMLLQYLNISKKRFIRRYRLPKIKIKKEKFYFKRAFKYALNHRKDIEQIKYEKKIIYKEKEFNELKNYPQTNLSLYGVHDRYYGNGFKVSLNVNIPLQRRGYKGRALELQVEEDNLRSKREKKVLELKRNLKQIINSLNTLKENIKIVKEELYLAKKLEKVQEERYFLGESTLFMLNQRELQTLQVEQKKVNYEIKYLLFKEAYKIEIAI